MSAIVLYQDWGFFVLLKGLISFAIVYVFKNQIVLGYNKFCTLIIYVMDGKSKKNKSKRID